MTERSVDSAGAGVALDHSLLAAKLTIPEPRPGSVSRAPVIAAARDSGCRVVGITAPAGYGKSTLLREWAHVDDRPVAWVSLDRFDDDPTSLLSLIASAYAKAAGPGSAFDADMSGLGASPLGRLAPRLASAFQASPEPFVLMVDDLHEVRSPACHDVLSVAIEGIPLGSQFVAASRAEQPHLPRLRASGDALELGVSDLALDAAGAEHIFSTVNVSVTPELAAIVTQRTEGWPVGVYLAAMIARDGPSDALTISGDDRYVADYLYRESLVRLPEEEQAFLRRTSMLEQLSGPLCDVVLEDSGSQGRLQELERTSQFLVPLDRQRQWYRYHALFREFLQSELRRVEPDITEKLHLRAADWYEAHAAPGLAVEHLLLTTERERCVQLVAELILPTYNAGNLTTTVRWLEALSASDIEAYPPLAVLAGWISVLAGDVPNAQRWAAVIEVAEFDAVPRDGTASFESARAMLRCFMCPQGIAQAVSDGALAASAEPAWSPWRDQALGIYGVAMLSNGAVDEAVALFEEAVAVGAAVESDAYVMSTSLLALVAMDHGRWDDAEGNLELALAAVEAHRMQDYQTSLLALAGAARLAVHRGDLHRANRELTRAMRARPSSTLVAPLVAVCVRLQLAKAYWSLGELATARHLLREIDDILVHRPDLGSLIEEVTDFRAMITGARQSGIAGATPLSPAELRLLPYLQTHLMMREIADRVFVSRNTVSSQVSSIYRKLGVSSRSEAVQQATAMGLLGA